MGYSVKIRKQVKKDLRNLIAAHLDKTFRELMDVIQKNPYQTPPPYEKLKGNLNGMYSRRLNIQHRLMYSVDEERKQVIVWAAWTHYER